MSSGPLQNTLKRLFSKPNAVPQKSTYNRSFSAPSQTTSHVADITPDHKKRVLIVGLGNYPAPRSRHSIGQYLLHHLARQNNVELANKRVCKSHVGSFNFHDCEVFLLKPKRFMNENGKCVHKAIQHFHIPPSHVLLLHDELDLPLGKFKLKNGGSANGHNGVIDVQDRLRYNDIKRIRIGIGRPENKNDVTDWVLGDFTKNERQLITVMQESLSDLVYRSINIIVTPPDLQEKLVEKLNIELEAAPEFKVDPVTPSPTWSPTPNNARLERGNNVPHNRSRPDALSTVIMLGALHKANYNYRARDDMVISPPCSPGRRRYSNETIHNTMLPYQDLDVRKDYNKRESKISKDCNKRVDYREYRRDRRYSDSSND